MQNAILATEIQVPMEAYFQVKLNEDEIDSADKGQLIFRVLQALLQQQAVQNEVTLEEHEKLYQEEVAARNKHEQESLHRIRDLEVQVNQLQQQSLLESSEKEKWSLRHEVANLKEEVHHYQLQLENQQDSSHADQQSAITTELLREKNLLLQKLLSRNKDLEKTNGMFEERVNEMKRHVENSATEMANTTLECTRLQELMQDDNTLISSLQVENEEVKKQLRQVVEENMQMQQAEEETVQSFNARLEDVKLLLQQKERELSDMQIYVERLQMKSDGASYDDSQLPMIEIAEIIRAKDELIRSLEAERKKGLDLSLNTETMKETPTTSCAACKENNLKCDKADQQVLRLRKELKQLNHQLSLAENHACQRDKEFTTVYARMKDYEQGEYGLSEAVAEIKELRNRLRMGERQVEELTNFINVNELLKLKDPVGNDGVQSIDTRCDVGSAASAQEDAKQQLDHIKDQFTPKNNFSKEKAERHRLLEGDSDNISPSNAECRPSKNTKDRNFISASTVAACLRSKIALVNKSTQTESEEGTWNTNLKYNGSSMRPKICPEVLSNTRENFIEGETVRLNSHLLQVLQKLENTDAMNVELEKKLEESRSVIKIAAHQLNKFYASYIQEKIASHGSSTTN